MSQLRLAILEVQDKSDAVKQAESNDTALDSLEELYMALLGACEDALRTATADVSRLSKAGRTAQLAEAHNLEGYVRRVKLEAGVRYATACRHAWHALD